MRNTILNKQYPLEFIENIFKLTLNKIYAGKQNNKNDNESDENNTTIESYVDHDLYMFINFG